MGTHDAISIKCGEQSPASDDNALFGLITTPHSPRSPAEMWQLSASKRFFVREMKTF